MGCDLVCAFLSGRLYASGGNFGVCSRVGNDGCNFVCRILLPDISGKDFLSFPPGRGAEGRRYSCRSLYPEPSFLPISRFALHICYSYDGSGAEKEGILQGMVPAKSSAEMELILLPRYCGVVTVSANALDIWDLLGIFCRHVRELGSQKTVLLPSNLSMRLDTVRLKTDMISLLEQEEQKGSGNIPPDVSQIHPYQEGEPLRFVHWS